MGKFFKKYHKWIGLFFSFFILMFSISGILLNHRSLISHINISRNLLPKSYRYQNWNNGAINGTFPLAENKIILYGSNGVWLSDSLLQNVENFNQGLPKGVDNRHLKTIIKANDSTLFAISFNHLFRLSSPFEKWQDVNLKTEIKDEILNDLFLKDSTLYLLTRSNIYKSEYPYNQFSNVNLQQPANYSNKVSLFKTIWVLHSGELFGTVGKLIVDLLGIILILLTITGLIITFWKIPIKRRKKQKKETKKLRKTWNFSLRWHNKLGYIPFYLLLLVAITGWFLRPPLLIAIIRAKVSPLPYSTLASDNPWHNKLRNIRYDKATSEWLLYTSDGFYEFQNFTQTPTKRQQKPPVSVMGINVWQQHNDSLWRVGSFSGMFDWNTKTGKIYDVIKKKEYKPKKRSGIPTFDNLISGYSADLACGEIIFDYRKGAILLDTTRQIPQQPNVFREKGKISLWHSALELHVGRLYIDFLGAFAPFFIFFAGLFFVFILISGYVVFKKFHKKKRKQRNKKRNNSQKIVSN